ncbi:LacI family DNA-binding transcriptional regulator [Streptomyces sp. NPDC057137]|uniref:LacI family DNA-binding transcriptional regulator n=1 Tax=Streptomyces sp. NPDC057137 TaxID=3346030 RepID=UPI0036417C35
MPKAATSADVAKLAGVSRATVSFVLNNAPQSIAPKTRENVLRSAKLLNYRPNLSAKALAEGTSRVVLFDLSAPSWHGQAVHVLAELTTALAEHGLVAAVHLDAPVRESLVVTALRIRPRLVLPSRALSPQERAELDDAGIVVVEAPVTEIADVEGLAAQIRLEHLRRRGHSRIAIAEREGAGLASVVGTRRHAVLAAAAELGIPEPMVVAFHDGASAVSQVQRIMAAGCSAVCAFNDDTALATIRAAADAGVRCPQDLAVIGADDIFPGSVSFPPLTTVKVDFERLGKLLAPTVLAALGVANVTPPPELDDVLTLVVREST